MSHRDRILIKEAQCENKNSFRDEMEYHLSSSLIINYWLLLDAELIHPNKNEIFAVNFYILNLTSALMN